MDFIKVQSKQELLQCLEVRKKVFVEEQQVPESLEVDEYDDLEHSGSTHILVLNGGMPVATGRYIEYQDNAAKFQRIAVLEFLRGTGLGRKLLNAMELEAFKSGFKHIILDSQCQAEAFYTKSGYVNTSSDIFMDAGIPHVRMKKELA
jgi:predicted GNAT family N-acyltransferase